MLQQAVGTGPPHAACWDEAGTVAGGAQPPELRAMTSPGEGVGSSALRCWSDTALLLGLGLLPVFEDAKCFLG